MQAKFPDFTRSYLRAMRRHLKDDTARKGGAAKALGLRAMAIALETLDLAKVHAEALISIVSSHEPASARETMIRRAGKFFAEVITPIELTHRGALEGNTRLTAVVGELTQRTKELAESNEQLVEEISRRKEVEETLRASEQTSSSLLEKSLQFQEELRLLSRRLLTVQEEERKRISRELHDLIAQTLAGINLQLAALKSRSGSDTNDLQEKIEEAQRLVEMSVDMVHRFARDLRPAVLDDLGLIPALKSYFKKFMEDTGIRVTLTAFADVEKLDSLKRTVLYRVAQEALNNVAQHAKAWLTEVKISQSGKLVHMEIHDNGQGFEVGSDIFFSEESKRLGLLGMRERVEMVGGSYSVESNPGKGTTVFVNIPRTATLTKKGPGKKSAKKAPAPQ